MELCDNSWLRMSTPSHPWKLHLLKQADVLERMQTVTRWTEASSVRLEESVVLGFYDIRKLIGAYLLGNVLLHEPVRIQAYPVRRRGGVILSDERLEDLYDLSAGRSVAHDLLFLCHQAIHNCLFAPRFSSGRRLQGVYLTSDHQRKVALYAIELPALFSLFRKVGGAV